MKRDQTLKSFSHLYLCKTQKSIIVPRQGISAIVSRVVFFFSPRHQANEQNWTDIDGRWLFSCSAMFASCWLPASALEVNKSPLCRSTAVRGYDAGMILTPEWDGYERALITSYMLDVWNENIFTSQGIWKPRATPTVTSFFDEWTVFSVWMIVINLYVHGGDAEQVKQEQEQIPGQSIILLSAFSVNQRRQLSMN